MGRKGGQGRRQQRAKEHYVETNEGERIPIRAVSEVLLTKIRRAFRQEWIERGEPIETPTYTATTVAGEEIELELDEKSLKVPGDPEATAENQAKWAAHVTALEHLDWVASNEVANCLLERGVIVEQERDGWEEAQRLFHVEIPEDPVERKRHYIMTELFPSPVGLRRVLVAVRHLSQKGWLTQEVLDAAEANFRRTQAEGTEGDTSEQAPDSQGEVAVLDEAGGGASGEGVGDNAD